MNKKSANKNKTYIDKLDDENESIESNESYESYEPESSNVVRKTKNNKRNKNKKEQKLFTVENILAKQLRDNTEKYLIKWKDYPFNQSTWEPRENLRYLEEALENFEKNIEIKRNKVNELFDKSVSCFNNENFTIKKEDHEFLEKESYRLICRRKFPRKAYFNDLNDIDDVVYFIIEYNLFRKIVETSSLTILSIKKISKEMFVLCQVNIVSRKKHYNKHDYFGVQKVFIYYEYIKYFMCNKLNEFIESKYYLGKEIKT